MTRRLPPEVARQRRLIRSRLIRWRERGVREVGGHILTWATFVAVSAFQGDRCALCGRDGFWGALAADHSERTGLFRGGLCQRDCNQRAVGTFERTGKFGTPEQATRIRAYLADPPYARWLREKGREGVAPGAFSAPRTTP